MLFQPTVLVAYLSHTTAADEIQIFDPQIRHHISVIMFIFLIIIGCDRRRASL